MVRTTGTIQDIIVTTPKNKTEIAEEEARASSGTAIADTHLPAQADRVRPLAGSTAFALALRPALILLK